MIDSSFIFPFGTFNFDFYDYYFIFLSIILFYLLTYRNLKLWPGWFITGISVFLIGTFIASYSENLIGFPLIKTLIGLFFYSCSYFLVIKMSNYDTKKIFQIYVNFALISSVFGIIQEIMALGGIMLFVGPIVKGGFFYRVSSLSGEPYFFSTVLLPALLYYTYLLIGPNAYKEFKPKNIKIKTSIIFVSYFLTFSSAGIFIYFLGVIIILIHKARADRIGSNILYIPITAILLYFSYTFLSKYDKPFENKITSSINFFGGGSDKKLLKNINSSSFSLTSNYLIMKKSFSENPIFGIGLGNYEYNYNLYFDRIIGRNFRKIYLEQNSKDGNSMFNRLITETGLWGTLIFLYFMIRYCIFFRKSDNKNLQIFQIIQFTILMLFLLRLLRTGNYFGQGFFFFFFLYFYAFKKYSVAR
jgi:hypothetical protein